ncbi:universal stress protein [Aquimarina gracilis]|uniref:Universal stress protein n=1 Tax=Aquimarina gracilis TaxID=874422 RepID=A0ABU5ZSP6_9FLAO|nr:universal stress protein [Aquimarina gracilis]MEB3345040.1 universal stress protein [Aquimarina gracilis]
MKRILIPTDFSANAWNTILYAMELYKNTPCEFHILNTYEVKPVQLISTVSSQRVGHYYDAVKIESKEGLEMILEDISNSGPDPKHIFKTFSKSGSLLEIVAQMTVADHFDQIVIGTKGATGAKEIFLGSNTHRIIKNIECCPILVVPDDVFFENITNIAFATNFERVYYKSEITPILQLAKQQGATVRMIHVYDKPELDIVQTYNSTSLERYFKDIKHDFHVIHNFSNLEKAIQSFIEELEVNLLVMINYEHSFIERLTRESVIKKMTFHTTIPFLVIPSDN